VAAPNKLVFLPGVGGDPAFWHPVGALLPGDKAYLGWPGAGAQPSAPDVRGFDDLVRRAVAALDNRSAIVAQSMGGIVAVRVARAFPERLTHLVLAATSGGVDVARFGAEDWRPDYRRAFPHAAPWLTETRPDHTADIGRITTPTLLIWGDADPISPLAVGQHLASLLPHATLVVVPGGTHSLAKEQPAVVAAHIRDHLAAAR